MNVVIVLEHRFTRTPDGAVWTQTVFPYFFWQRYLEIFDQVRVVARVLDVSTADSNWIRADGQNVSFAAIPYYIGPWQYLQRMRQVQWAVKNAVSDNDAVILRVGSQIADCIQPMLHQVGHPYAVEVVADPYDVFAPGSVKHPLRLFFRWHSPRQLRRHCAEACAAAYVTQQALQRRYPCPNYSVGISDVDLPNEAFASTPRAFCQETYPLTILYVGTMAQLYKAPDILIQAVAVCVQEGLDLKLTLVGDGKYRAELEAQATELGLEKRICFVGQLPAGDAIRAHLDQANLFVLPSHQEGLPRAMVEAMARALPCIGSTVGGIPELLPLEDLVPSGQVTALASKIREVATDRDRMVRMSVRNLEKAKEYRDDVLRGQRVAFYRYVQEQTETWIKL